MIAIVSDSINVDAVIQSVAVPEAGAINVFVGTTRNHSSGKRVLRLEYDAYVPMAEKMMAQIEKEIRSRWEIHKISMVHMIGRLEIGMPSVVIAVSSFHRNEAFEASRYAIDRLKSIVPIWKKEFLEDGEEWVEGVHTEPEPKLSPNL
jgi:molybdopterin synthase catalytic subunit